MSADAFQRVANAQRAFYQLLRASSIEDDTGHRGQRLSPGIAALVCCKDEEYSVRLCLASLLPLADQIVCVDNGSSDGTLEVMRDFERRHGAIRHIVVIDASGFTLCEARNQGLAAVERSWLLKCDGDFVFHTDGPLNARVLLKRLTSTRFRCAYRLGFVNLWGDLRHTSRLYSVYTLGEYYLVRFGPSVRFVERGRFDYISFPRYYLSCSVRRPLFFHLSTLKADERLLYRNCYFDWREAVNDVRSTGGARAVAGLGEFRNWWEREHFGTNESRSLKFRFQRQMAVAHYTQYCPEDHCPYPSILVDELRNGPERFEVVYRGGRPYLRIDHEDTGMLMYQPTDEDLRWDPSDYLRRVLSAGERERLGL